MGELGLLDLPDLVLDHIFSYLQTILSNEKAIRLSLVSKHFFTLLHNRFSLTLVVNRSEKWYARVRNDENFRSACKVYEKEVEELRYMCSTLKRYHDENIPLNTLKFHVGGNYLDDDGRHFGESIELAAKSCRLTSLDLKPPRYYRDFPEAVFGVRSLVEFRLKDCCLRPERVVKVCLPNLRKLCLERVYMGSNQRMLENMIRGCPSIETLSMRSCSLDSPGFSLEQLSLGKLKTLDLHKTPIADANLFNNNFAGKFPRLECLCAGPVLGTARIYLCSPSLKEIQLQVKDHEEACFSVPNIASFKYKQDCRLICDVLPKLSFKSGGCIAQIKLKECTDDMHGSWFSRQKQFFAGLNMPCEASIEVDFSEKLHLSPDHWMNARPDLSFAPAGIIAGVQKFKITHPWEPVYPLSFARAILNAIFLNFRPQTIVFHWRSDSYDRKLEHNVKFPWDSTTNSPTSEFDEILKLLESDDNDRVHKERGFNIVFNLA